MSSTGVVSSSTGSGIIAPPPEPLSDIAAAAAAIATTAAIVPALTPPIAVFAATSPAADPPVPALAACSTSALTSCGTRKNANPVMVASILFEIFFIFKPVLINFWSNFCRDWELLCVLKVNSCLYVNFNFSFLSIINSLLNVAICNLNAVPKKLFFYNFAL